jgi:TonB family protein
MTKWALMLIALGLNATASAAERSSQAGEPGARCQGGDREIRLLERPEPYYPHSAMMYCLGGEVRVEFTVDARGATRDHQIVDSEPAFIFDRAAIDAIERWRFSPACRDGRAADRRAVQIIVFDLLPETRDRCIEWQSPLDERSLALISEVGARYALLAEYARAQLDWADIETAVDAPFPSFDGDLEQVAEFHRQVLARSTPNAEDRRLGQGIQRVTRALQPDAIAADPDLDPARESVDRLDAALEAWLQENQDQYAELATAYRHLERETRLDAATLERLVVPFAGDYRSGFDEWAAPHLETLERARAIVDFLDQNRPSWEASGQAIHFDREADARAWHGLWQELMDHQEMHQSQYLAFMRSFEDYMR